MISIIYSFIIREPYYIASRQSRLKQHRIPSVKSHCILHLLRVYYFILHDAFQEQASLGYIICFFFSSLIRPGNRQIYVFFHLLKFPSVMTGEVFDYRSLGFSCFYFLRSCHIFGFYSQVRARLTLTYHIS